MKNKDIDDLLGELDFNIEEPSTGHREKFLGKLNDRKTAPKSDENGKLQPLLVKVFSIAASIVIAVFLLTKVALPSADTRTDLANISPEMKKTQDFYTGLIEKELNQLKNEESPKTRKIVEDALHQLNILEKEYTELKKDLKISGKDQRVIYAMIQNFQQRIDLLNHVLEQIENLKTIKNIPHENNII